MALSTETQQAMRDAGKELDARSGLSEARSEAAKELETRQSQRLRDLLAQSALVPSGITPYQFPTGSGPQPAPPSAPAQDAPAPVQAAEVPAAPPDPAAQMTQRIADLMGQYVQQSQGVSRAQQSAMATREGLVKPALQEVERQALSPQPPKPSILPEPKMPDTKPRPFLTADGATALQTIVAGIGSLVTSLAGLSAPVGALNALTGAMNGWAEGDATRAAKEWQTYEAHVSKMQRENSTALNEWERARVERADDMGARQALLQARLAEAGLADYSAQVAEKGFDRTGQLIGLAQTQLHNYQTYENKVLKEQLSMAKFMATEKHRELSDRMLEERIKASSTGELDQQTLHAMAEQYLAGDKAVKTNIGRGMQGPKNIAALNTMIYQVGREKGMTPQDIAASQAEFEGLKAGERTLANRSVNIEMALTEAQALIPALKTASQNLSRSDSPVLNRFLKSMNLNLPFDENMNAAQVQFGVALNSFINVYARAISPSGVKTVSDTEHARDLLVDTWSRGAIDAGIDQLIIELEAASQSPGKVRAQLRETVAPKKKPDAAPKKTPTVDELLQKYR